MSLFPKHVNCLHASGDMGFHKDFAMVRQETTHLNNGASNGYQMVSIKKVRNFTILFIALKGLSKGFKV